MPQAFEVRPIKPKDLNVAAFNDAVERGLDEGAKRIKRAFGETQSTFKRKAPVIIQKGRQVRLIWVDSETYGYLSRGTKVRWALMSGDWQSKTRPGRFKPGPGRGRVVIAGRRAMQRRGIGPRPGIKARNYPQQVIKREGKKVQAGISAQIGKAAKKAF